MSAGSHREKRIPLSLPDTGDALAAAAATVKAAAAEAARLVEGARRRASKAGGTAGHGVAIAAVCALHSAATNRAVVAGARAILSCIALWPAALSSAEWRFSACLILGA